MNDIDQATIEKRTAAAADRAVARWLAAFEDALAKADTKGLAALFVPDSHWRDVLAFTWHITPTVGVQAIAQKLADRQATTRAQNFTLAKGRTPPRKVRRL
ncbi:MAG TPA: monooxygenase, partial [Hyphomicrobiaceae bacterium]|nr:monooxygenase [Hyphomicrobiaceae bacterium]